MPRSSGTRCHYTCRVNPRHLVLLAAALSATPAHALQTRPDRDDAEYLELASRYRAAVKLPAALGEGVLISARWVLTAPAPAQLLREIAPTPVFTIGEREYAIDSVQVGEDLGLVLLHAPVRDVQPVPVYRAADELGKGVAIVGHGPAGPIGGPTKVDHKARAALNTIDAVSAAAFEVRIKSGDDAPDLQGALTKAEAGAPAFITTDDGRIHVAGIARSADGKREVYTRVSSRIDWIESTMWEAAKKEAAKK